VLVGPQQTITIWASVRPSDWCGEGEPGMSGDSIAAGKQALDKKNGKH
jgi:hypothetical protein